MTRSRLQGKHVTSWVPAAQAESYAAQNEFYTAADALPDSLQLIGHQTHISSLISSTSLLLPHPTASSSASNSHQAHLLASTSKNRHRGSPHPSGRAGSELPGQGQAATTPSKKKKHKSSTLTLGDGEGWDEESLLGGRKGSPAPSALAAATGGAVGTKKKNKEKGVGGTSKKKR